MGIEDAERFLEADEAVQALAKVGVKIKESTLKEQSRGDKPKYPSKMVNGRRRWLLSELFPAFGVRLRGAG